MEEHLPLLYAYTGKEVNKLIDRYVKTKLLDRKKVNFEELKSRLNETFAEACQNYNKTSKKVKISTYLYKALRNTVIDYLNELVKPAEVIPPDVQVKCEWVIDERTQGGPHRKNGKPMVRHHKRWDNISINMNGLSSKQRKVLDLFYNEDCPIDFIAEFFGVGERTVNRTKKRALEVLKDTNSHIHVRQRKAKKKRKISRKEEDSFPQKLHLSGPTGVDAA